MTIVSTKYALINICCKNKRVVAWALMYQPQSNYTHNYLTLTFTMCSISFIASNACAVKTSISVIAGGIQVTIIFSQLTLINI